MLRHAIDHGVNYIDIDCPGDYARCEQLVRLVGRALQCEYRERVKVAATLPRTKITESLDFEERLDDLTRWLRTDIIDFLIFGGLDRQTWPALESSRVVTRAEKAMEHNRIGKIGFDFYDDFQTLRNILNSDYNWSLVRFRYSFMEYDWLAGVGVLRLAAERGLAVIATDPLKSGRLARNLPEPVARLWANTSPHRSAVEWAFRWAWDHPEISTVVSEMTDMEQLQQTITLADMAEADSLTVNEQILVSQARDIYRKMRPVPCTGCHSCMPCPQGIDAPRIFELYNDAVMYNESSIPASLYRAEGHSIDDCDMCGACSRACGRSIDIPERLREADRALSSNCNTVL
jgi:uncharacterized protein